MGADHSLEKIVLFDGLCNLCSASVQFILRHSSKSNISFASLQSDYGQIQLNKFQLSQDVKTFIFIRKDKVFVRSDAALEISKELDGIYKGLSLLRIFPRSLRDFVYDFIAKNRYRWFGKKDQCWTPSPEISKRFIS